MVVLQLSCPILHSCAKKNAVFFFVAGDHFSAGLDLADNSNLTDIAKTSKDAARRAFRFRKLALAMQVGYSPRPACTGIK